MSWLDTKRHPLDVLRLPAEYTHAELCAEFDALEAYYASLVARSPNARLALLVDTSRRASSDARNRQRIGESYTRLSPVLKAHGVGQAFVIAQPLLRGALQAVFWIRRPPWPTDVFASFDEADAWLRGLLRDEGIAIVAA